MAEQRTGRARPEKGRTSARSGRPSDAAEAARVAADNLGALIDHPLDGTSSIRRAEHDGWFVGLDVVEVRRIPDTTSLLATYEVELDAVGELVGYRRVRRYRRCDADE